MVCLRTNGLCISRARLQSRTEIVRKLDDLFDQLSQPVSKLDLWKPDLTTPEQDPDISINTALLRSIVRRRRPLWLALGVGLFCLLEAYQLLYTGQAFTALTTVSMQQPSPSAAGGVAALLGGQTQTKKYIGVLHSRTFAERVEAQTHLAEFYHMRSKRLAVEMLMKQVKPEDNAADGLLFINVTLGGPPLLAPGSAPRRAEVKALTARVANLYAQELADYYTNNDNERDTVLLNAAKDLIKNARAGVDNSTRRIEQFVRGLNKQDIGATPAPTVESGAAVPPGLLNLIEEQGKVSADISALKKGSSVQESGVNNLLKHLSILPDEDPLLGTARDKVSKLENKLKRLQQNFAPENQQVLQAHQDLKIAQEDLDRQESAIKSKQTTENVDIDRRLAALKARSASIQALIERALKQLPKRRESTSKLQRLLADRLIAAKKLEAEETEFVKLQINTVSGQSKTSVIDTAIEPEVGSPGILRVSLLSLGVALFAVLVGIIVSYIRQVRAAPQQISTYPTSFSTDFPVVAAPKVSGQPSAAGTNGAAGSPTGDNTSSKTQAVRTARTLPEPQDDPTPL